MPVPTRSIAGLALAAAVAVALSACSLTSSVSGTHDWSQETTLPDGTTQTITVHDESGRLTNVEINPEGVAMASEISNPAGAENVVLVPWAGGACDVKTEFVFKAQGQGLAGTLKTTTSGEICTMMAVLHQLRLTSSAPLPAAQVTLDPAP
jgi:ABC-type Fe3+-hydroxamate transport system substrate-binding protein